MNITLNCGRVVKVNTFQLGYTYGGLLGGYPHEVMNKHIFDTITYPSNWGSRKVLKIEPEEAELKTELKPSYYTVWLSSDVPVLPQNDGSELVVIWFGDSPDGKTVEAIIERGIKAIDWNTHAEDINY